MMDCFLRVSGRSRQRADPRHPSREAVRALILHEKIILFHQIILTFHHKLIVSRWKFIIFQSKINKKLSFFQWNTKLKKTNFQNLCKKWWNSYWPLMDFVFFRIFEFFELFRNTRGGAIAMGHPIGCSGVSTLWQGPEFIQNRNITLYDMARNPSKKENITFPYICKNSFMRPFLLCESPSREMISGDGSDRLLAVAEK